MVYCLFCRMQHTFYKQTLLTLQSMQSQSAADDKESELATGMASLNLDAAGGFNSAAMTNLALNAATVFETEPRSSSAMAEYRPTEFVPQYRGAGLPHSISSPSLSVPSSATNLIPPGSTATSVA